MLLQLLDWLDADTLTGLEKITLRASLAAIVAFVAAILFGVRLIAWLKVRFREPNRSDSERVKQLHRDKQWTPTMGGLFIVTGLVLATLCFGDLSNPLLHVSIFTVIGLAIVGAIDDLTKLRGSGNGLTARKKLFLQTAVATIAALLIYRIHSPVPHGLDLTLPLLGIRFSLGRMMIPLAVLVIVGSCNAVNLTDGLDGLAGGCLIFATSAITLLVYASGHAELARYLNLTPIPLAGEMTVVAAAMIGGVLGFLWFNCHPAQVFMGDTGSLPLGGLLGLLAVVCRQELLLVLIGGVFVVEAASVIIQVVSYRWRRQRVFLCAPLHHHFQFKGWPESKIVVRFWIASALCAILGVAAVKLSINDPAANRPANTLSQRQPVRELP